MPRLGFLYLLALLCLVPLYRMCPLPSRLSRFLDGWANENRTGSGAVDWCPLPDVVVPRNDGLRPSEHLMESRQRDLQVKRLSSAVQVPTESYDDNGSVDDDPRWATFGDFHSVLAELFPLIHSKMHLRKVNRYGLLYTLNGSEPSLKPILFMAHQDVVPADGSSGWTYPPYAGHCDGSFVWGRGSSDCKNVLIGILSAIESLLSQSFAPRRTVVLSFGFDEETGGKRGATKLSQALVQEWGEGSFLFAMDEGGMGVQSLGDVMYAYPGVGEKGYYDVELELKVRGGHSSRPPPHTGIGIMADVTLALENANYQPRLTESSPFRRVLECRAAYSPKHVDPWVHDILHSGQEEISRELAEELGEEQWLVQTSQAVDVVSGGIKVNALPETVRLMINHRVMMHESIDAVDQHIYDALTPIAKKYNLEFRKVSVGDKDEGTSSGGVLSVKPLQTLPPAPLTPTGSNSVWQAFSGTLRQVFETTDAGRGKTVVPVGNIMTGNTDTVHYWDITRNIYRYTPARDGTRLNTHAIDERMEMTAHLEGIRVYYDLIRNFDSWDTE